MWYQHNASNTNILLLFSHLSPTWLYHIFPHCLIKGKLFGKRALSIKFVFSFCLQNCPMLGKFERDIIINVHRSCEVSDNFVRF